MALKKDDGNYLHWALGGLFLMALLVLAGYALAGTAQGCVGVVRIDGEIVSEDVSAGLFSDEIKGARTIAGEIRDAGKRPDVKSLLIVIDSPGGSSVGSRQLYDAVAGLDKPAVAYVNELAASGGYYVAAGTDYVVITPEALTGNIGARMSFADMSALFEKIGLRENVIKTGDMKDIGSPARPMTVAEQEVLGEILNESFAAFREAVERGRAGKLDPVAFETVLDGRIVSGRQAVKIGLADELGDREDAVAKAARLGGIESDEPRLCDLSSSSGNGKGLLGTLSAESILAVAERAVAPRSLYG